MIALLQAGYYAEPHAARYDAATMGMFVLIIAIGVIGFIVQALSLIHISEPTRPY